jgi:adenosylcobinamide-GDP ribazoletransferase
MTLRWCQNLIVPPLLAIQFLTRIPIPGLSRLGSDEVAAGLVRAVGWFPLAGGLVGAISAAVLVLADGLWSRSVAVILTLIVEARLTGAFHEDAVADFCDGFGGGQTPERIHEIMKDSRIGAYGSVGLILAIGLRAALLCALPADLVVPALIASTAFGRWLAVVPKVLLPSPPGVEGLASEIVSGTGLSQLIVASFIAVPFLLPFIWLRPDAALLAIIAAAAFMWWLCRFLMRHLGGVTGDCLGFAVYAGQLIVLLAVTARWPAL